MDLRPVANDHRKLAIVSPRQMLLEAVEAHRRDIDLKLLRGILIESGQFLRFEHPLNQPERRADPPPGETVAGIAADAEQFRKQSQTAEHPEKSPIAVGDRKPGAPRFPQHSDRVEQRCSGVNRRNRRNDIANPGVDIIAADRRFEMKAPEKRRGPIRQYTGTECGDAAVSLPAAQFRQCGGRSKTVNIRITVAADQHPVLGIPFGTHCISPCISLSRRPVPSGPPPSSFYSTLSSGSLQASRRFPDDLFTRSLTGSFAG